MAKLVLVIDSTDAIAELNVKIQRDTKPEEAVQNVQNYLSGLMGGMRTGTVQVTIRDTDPSVSTSGSGSTQVSYSFS